MTLGFALGDADHGVRESGGPNRGPRISEYLRNTDPPINTAAPWCAAWVQYCADRAARALKVANPLFECRTIEGNTNEIGGREGDGVYLKVRRLVIERTRFIRWAP